MLRSTDNYISRQRKIAKRRYLIGYYAEYIGGVLLIAAFMYIMMMLIYVAG